VSSDIAVAPPEMLLGAAIPVVGYVVLLWLAWRGPERATVRLAAFAWGVLAAPAIAVHANDLLLARAPDLTPVLFAPLVEEIAKAAALALLLVVPNGGIRTGIGLGALAGLGFSLTENIGYLTLAALQDGTTGMWRAIWLRGVVGGSKHAVFTATAGAAIGWARGARASTRRIAGFAVAGLAAAVLQHVLWNGVASRVVTDVLCHATSPGGWCAGPDAVDLLVRIPVLTVMCLAPGVLGLVVVARRAAAGSRPPGMRRRTTSRS
jgi:RsiW-degrading membrane proteinase PrsW (M82 family)